jgi:putative endopeptidase
VQNQSKSTRKIKQIQSKIAYPDQWEDYSKLTLLSQAEGGTYYKNTQNISAWGYQKI